MSLLRSRLPVTTAYPRRAISRGLVLGLVTACVYLALAAAAAAQQDSVIGSGENDEQPFSINAVSGPSGENASGSYSQQLRIGNITGDVTCLLVVGTQAVAGGTVTGGDVVPPGSGFFLHVDDRDPLADLTRLELGFAPGAFCPTPLLVSPSLVTVGDIVVTDAAAPPAFPTTIAECRNGGWRTFGFHSVAHCLAFVAQLKLCEALEARGRVPPLCPPRPPSQR